MQQTTTLTIREPRLCERTITVSAESTAELALHTPHDGGNTWYALEVDGQRHNLIMWKHTVGRPETIAALERALAQVQSVIASLQPPTPHFDALVGAALERLAAENAQSARTARYAGLKDDAKFFQRACNAYVRALEEWLAGTRPTRTEGGNYLLPSRSGGAAHLLTLDGDWVCSCASGQAIHWASALIIGMEVAGDDQDRFDDGDDGETAVSEPEPPTPTPGWCCTWDSPCMLHDPCALHVEAAAEILRKEAEQLLWRRVAAERARLLAA